MAYDLVTEVLDHAPATITNVELVVMVAIAEWVQHDDYRRGIRQCSRAQADLSRRTRLAPAGVKTALQRLAERGLELRVPLSIGKDGRPVYAVPGRVSTYRIPPLPAPPGCSCSNCRAKQGGTTGSPSTNKGGPQAPLGGTTGSPSAGQNGVKGGPQAPPTGKTSGISGSDVVIDELRKRTGKTVTAEWAERITRHLLDNRADVHNPVAYLRGVIRKDDKPERFLPTPQPPRYRNGEFEQ